MKTAPSFIFGNAKEDITHHPEYRQWFVGSFLNPSSPLRTPDVEIKWGSHKKGERDENAGYSASTLSLFLRGKFRLLFPELHEEVLLEKEGDYAFFGPGIAHTNSAEEDSVILTIRWPSNPTVPPITNEGTGF